MYVRLTRTEMWILIILLIFHPKKPLLVVFQPHRYARLERYFDEFASVLSTADQLVVVPVFAAWCESGKVGGRELADVSGGEYFDGEWKDIAVKISQFIPASGGVIAVLGAGDVEKVIPHLSQYIH